MESPKCSDKRRILNYLVNNGPSQIEEIVYGTKLLQENVYSLLQDLIAERHVLKECHFGKVIYGVNEFNILDLLLSNRI